MKKPKPKPPPLLCVDILEAKPNPLFTEAQRAAVRFLRYSQRVPCAECGKKLWIHWTMLCQFRVQDMGAFAVLPSSKSHPPLTPVCRDHIMAPDWTEPPTAQKKTS